MGMIRKEVDVVGTDGQTVVRTTKMPEVFGVQLRADIVQKTFSNVRQNRRQAYAVSETAGMQHSAESWGTGRAMARVPRVKASGTRRAGQAAFANFARKGRMAHPTKTHRRWHKKTPLNTRRIATAVGVAATADAAVVEGRGHRISRVKSLPIVLSNEINAIQKTKEAAQLFKTLGLDEDLERVANSRTITPGKGKYRNRRYNQRTGVLVVHTGQALAAFRGMRGVEFCHTLNH